MTNTSLDFGYPFWLNYGHLSVFAIAALVLAAAWRLRAPVWLVMIVAVVALWAGAVAAFIAAFGINTVPALPTQTFLARGEGRVLDLGAGTGRSSIMVLQARPKATLVASDLFGESFDQHFGADGTPHDRLRRNLEAASVADRATIATADMRKLPFEDASFDAAVSAYAMDHLGGDGARQALAETHRVLRPDGDFLLILVANDRWTMLAFGPLLAHGGLRGLDWWRSRAEEAGFAVVESGTSPATRYFLLRRRPA
jgi:SAM-dependent methyltransferase